MEKNQNKYSKLDMNKLMTSQGHKFRKFLVKTDYVSNRTQKSNLPTMPSQSEARNEYDVRELVEVLKNS